MDLLELLEASVSGRCFHRSSGVLAIVGATGFESVHVLRGASGGSSQDRFLRYMPKPPPNLVESGPGDGRKILGARVGGKPPQHFFMFVRAIVVPDGSGAPASRDIFVQPVLTGPHELMGRYPARHPMTRRLREMRRACLTPR